jgi:hypothetical protein
MMSMSGMSGISDPKRPYTPYQRREVIVKLAANNNISVMEAAERFKALEFSDLRSLADLCAKFPEEPPAKGTK